MDERERERVFGTYPNCQVERSESSSASQPEPVRLFRHNAEDLRCALFCSVKLALGGRRIGKMRRQGTIVLTSTIHQQTLKESNYANLTLKESCKLWVKPAEGGTRLGNLKVKPGWEFFWFYSHLNTYKYSLFVTFRLFFRQQSCSPIMSIKNYFFFLFINVIPIKYINCFR